MDIKFFNLYFADLHYNNSSEHKDRPIIILEINNNKNFLQCLKITAATHKDNYNNYCDIVDWKEAGLTKESIIDLTESFVISQSSIRRHIGKLSERDVNTLLNCLSKSNLLEYVDYLDGDLDDDLLVVDLKESIYNNIGEGAMNEIPKKFKFKKYRIVPIDRNSKIYNPDPNKAILNKPVGNIGSTSMTLTMNGASGMGESLQEDVNSPINIKMIFVHDDITDIDDLQNYWDEDELKEDYNVQSITDVNIDDLIDSLKLCNNIYIAPRVKNKSFLLKYDLSNDDCLTILHSLEKDDFDQFVKSINDKHLDNDLAIFKKSNINIEDKQLGDIKMYIKLDLTESDGNYVIAVSFHEDKVDEALEHHCFMYEDIDNFDTEENEFDCSNCGTTMEYIGAQGDNYEYKCPVCGHFQYYNGDGEEVFYGEGE